MNDTAHRIAEDLAARLRVHACEANRIGMSNYFTTGMRFLGVKMPFLRTEVRKTAAQSKAEGGETLFAAALELAGSGVFEDRIAAYELLSRHKAAFRLLDRKRLERVGKGNDNWACVDTLACLLSGPRWLKGELADADIRAWLASPDVWWRRTAIVSTTALNKKTKGGKGDFDRTVAVVTPVLHERHPMIVKAVSWALRSLVDWEPQRLREYVAEHEAELASLARRELRTKLDTGRKNPRRGG
jgi:3-methyladenine DNA glycosylase AlkD